MPVEEAQPLPGTIVLRKVVMRLFRDLVVPIIDDWGYCIGLLHSEDCNEVFPNFFEQLFSNRLSSLLF